MMGKATCARKEQEKGLMGKVYAEERRIRTADRRMVCKWENEKVSETVDM
jgi:hypothetical protein